MTQVISIILELYNNNSRKIVRSIKRIMATELFEKIPFSLSDLQNESVTDIEAFGAARIYEPALAMLEQLCKYQENTETPPLDALLVNELFSNQRHFQYLAKDVEIFTATLQEIIKLDEHECEIGTSDTVEYTSSKDARYKSLIELLHDAAFWILIKLSQPKYVRRRFKQLVRHEIAWEASENKKIGGKSGTKYASAESVEFQKKLDAHRDAWLEGKFINYKGKKISLATISRNRKQTYAAVACKAYGLIDIAKHKEYECMLITVTCPPHLHPNPTKGTSSWEKGNLELAPAYLSSGWEKFGKELSRLNLEPSKHRVFGLRTTELHADGTPHWHITFYYPPRNATKIKRLFTKHFGPHRGAASFERHSIPQDNKSRADGKTALIATNYTIKNIWSPMLFEDIFDEKQVNKIKEQVATESTLKMLGVRAYQFFGLGQKPQLWDLIRKLCNDHELVIKNEKKSFLDDYSLNKLQFAEDLPVDCYLSDNASAGYSDDDFAELATAAVSGKFGEFFLHPNIDNALYVYRGTTERVKIAGLKVGEKFLLKKIN